jgi:hypothetical protein
LPIGLFSKYHILGLLSKLGRPVIEKRKAEIPLVVLILQVVMTRFGHDLKTTGKVGLDGRFVPLADAIAEAEGALPL